MQKSSTEFENICPTATGRYLVVSDGSASTLPMDRTFTVHAVSGSYDPTSSSSSSLGGLPSTGYVLYEEEDLEAPAALRKVIHMAADGHGRPQKLVELDTQYSFAQQRDVLLEDTQFYSVDGSFEDNQPLEHCVNVDSEYTLSGDSEMNEGTTVGQTQMTQLAYVYETATTTTAVTNPLEVAVCESALKETSNSQREAKKKVIEDVRMVRSKDVTLREEEEEEKLTLPSPAMLNDMMSRVQMYPAVSGAPQPAVQPQQYSPVAARYPTPVQNASGISPCYPPTAHDMRSPQLMSPTQAPVVPAGIPQAAPPTMVAPVPASAPPMQRSMSNIELQGNGATIAPQHMRMVPQSTPLYGHEPSIANNVSPDMCLMGCFFVVVEHERVLVDRLDVQEISAVVRLHGGEIEFGPRAYNAANADRITHVICESLRHQLVQQALKERKRCVTLQWLNDILAKKHLEAPFRVAHLPTFWADNHRPASGKIIAINGFNHNERSGIRMMITAIGARFTPYLTKHNHFLVTKTVEGEKVERSRELGVTIVNYQWLVELYLGIKTAIHDNESGYYPIPGMFPEVNVSPYTLELYSEVCKQLLAAWKTPVIFSTEQWQRASEVKRSVENDESVFPNKKLRMSTPPPSEEQIEERRAQLGSLKDAPIVCFSGFTPEEVAALEKKVRFLGGQVTDNVSECTHLVVLNLWRTMKLLEAIALGKNVVGANWVTDGYRCRVIPDTLDYFARDEENEKAFGYNLKYSVLRARYRKVFEEVTFYVTPSVEPSYKAICSLIATAGGKLLKDKPQPHFVIQCIETDTPLILVGNESDVHLLQYLTDCGMPVFNVEIVLTGILRQKLENSSLYRVAPVRPPVQQLPAQATPTSRTQNAAQRVAT